ncbi:pentatricopeptide repeat-containing protein-like [Iris pallida]|uniref:Pentatricopeptide repeat-containing protein-like n=1 Tax=Iris pallida TaxID=29817 RepID=A0AAX6EFZ2_IRIPA|nr:pentatricopeptide repeat-containing protein-like [Iris pallida]
MLHAKPDAGVGVGAMVVVREKEQCSKRMSPRTTTKWKKHRQQCAIQSIPPLFRRPQHILPKPKPQVDDTESKDDTGGGNSTADVLRLMDALRVPVDECMYVSLLKDCTHTRDPEQGSMVHNHIQQQKKSGSKRCVINLSNRLLLMYAACDRHDDARQLFDGMPLRDANSWATVVSALADSGNYGESVRQFVRMLDAWGGWVAVEELDATLVFLLKVVLRACVRARVKGFGQQIHGLALKTGATGALGGNLLRFYATTTRCHGIVPLAFKRLVEGARRADRRNKNNDEASLYANILMACARMADGRQVHADAIKVGLDGDGLVRSRLVEMYARFGVLGDARRAFEASSNTSNSDDACWHAMLYGYVRNGCCVEAIRLLYDMKAAGVEPKESMVRKVRNACGR